MEWARYSMPRGSELFRSVVVVLGNASIELGFERPHFGPEQGGNML